MESKNIIEAIFELQKKRIPFPCPRCGKDVMNVDPIKNAFSRHANVYVCDACGMDEALRDAVCAGALDINNVPKQMLPYEDWAICKGLSVSFL